MLQFKISKNAPFWVELAGVAITQGLRVWQAHLAVKRVHDQQRLNGGSHSAGGPQAGAFQPKMTRKEAALILGVSESAAEAKIKEAHRRAMIANHPDTGGSNYLAAKINEAKDIMIRE